MTLLLLGAFLLPLAALPAVLRLTRHHSVSEKKHTAFVATSAIGIILLIATWIGTPLLAILGIKLPAFQIAGGGILLVLAISMLNASESSIKQSPEEQKEKYSGESIAIVPLAIPIIAGPGAISTVIVAVNEFPGVLNQIYLSFCALLVTGVSTASGSLVLLAVFILP